MQTWIRKNSEAPTARTDFVVAWVKALLDPSAKQGRKFLLRTNGHACCLGIAAILAGIKHTRIIGNHYLFEEDIKNGLSNSVYEGRLPRSIAEFLKMPDDGMFYRDDASGADYFNVKELLKDYTLAGANDSGAGFPTIALALSSYPRAFFRDLTEAEASYIIESEPAREARNATCEATRAKAGKDPRTAQ